MTGSGAGGSFPALTRYRESENLEMEKPIRLSCASLGARAALLPVVNVLVLCPIPFSMCRLIGLSPLPRGIYATARLCSLAGWFSQSSPRIIPSLIPVHYSVGTRVLQSSFSVPASGWQELFAARHSNFKNKRRMSSPWPKASFSFSLQPTSAGWAASRASPG